MAKERVKEENLDPVYFIALDGNVKAAMEKLSSIDPKLLSPVELQTRQKYMDRFGKDFRQKHPANSKLIDDVMESYESYWHEALLQKMNQQDGYLFLFKKLAPIVNRLGGKAGEFSENEYDRISEFLTKKLKETGYYAKIGAVKPYLNFMAWKRQVTKSYQVDLGNGNFEKVDVVLMQDFVSLGWAAYATFDKLHVGGWVGDHALYCVASAYDLESEEFKVSFLAHEARHFADKRTYRDLTSVELEYRAKLTEIILADQSFDEVVKKFILEQKDNPDNPHSYASLHLINDLSRKLGKSIDLAFIRTYDKEQIRRNAKMLLKEDSERLEMAHNQ